MPHRITCDRHHGNTTKRVRAATFRIIWPPPSSSRSSTA